MIKDVEFSENIENFRAPGFPSYDEIIEYEARGEGKKNALEYEKAYIALIEQVKDKPREEQVKFLLEHIVNIVLRLLTMQEVLKVEFPPNAEEKRRKRKISLPKNIQKNIRLY